MLIWAEVGFEPVAVRDRFCHGIRDRPFGKHHGRHRDEDFLSDRPEDVRVRRIAYFLQIAFSTMQH